MIDQTDCLTATDLEFLRVFLTSCTVPEHSNCFVLGSFDHKKTVRTQMDRAAVMSRGIFERNGGGGARVAVVGAGFAGVAAAATLLQFGFKVTLFETKRLLVPLQKRCYDRFIHPNSYDWPGVELSEDYDLAGLRWSAGYADQVSAQVTECFEEVRSRFADSYTEELETSIEMIRPVRKEGDPEYDVVDDQKYSYGKFAFVILSVGFGPEKHVKFGDKVDGYWENSALLNAHGTQDRPTRLLISGAGDGSLVSVVEAVFEESDHAALVRLLEEWLSRETIDDLIMAEKSFLIAFRESRDARILESYNKILQGIIKDLKPKIELSIKSGVSVTLNSSLSGIFSPGSSPLNRIIIYLLYRTGIISLRQGRLDDKMVEEEIGPDGIRRYKVTWTGGEVRNYDRLITRYGVNPRYVLTSVRGLPKETMAGLEAYRELELERSIPEGIFRSLRW